MPKRFDLNCPFSEKDEAKALGARWDAEKRTWYIEGKTDLTPFAKWLPRRMALMNEKRAKPRITGTTPVPQCNCDVPPWEDCEHTDMEAHRNMLELLQNWTPAEGNHVH
jgi:hypothetical protein